jgi:alpha-tubulin suppressor-like RCC1 family protein
VNRFSGHTPRHALPILAVVLGFLLAAPAAFAGVAEVAAGGEYTCALKGDGTVMCWGFNAFGQLGDGTTINRLEPVVVKGLTDATAIATGFDHACALKEDGTVECWGANGVGQLGDGTGTDRDEPVPVKGLTDATAITTGSDHTCALK